MKPILSAGRKIIEIILSFWQRVSVPEYQTFKFQRNQWLKTLSPSVIVDVGANTGQWAKDFREVFPTLGHLVSFEPDSRAWEDYKTSLSGYQADLVRAAAGSFSGEADLFEWNLDGGSSSLMPLTQEGEVFTKQNQRSLSRARVKIVRLDNYLREIVKGVPIESLYVKIDVQGGELDVLDGLQGVIASVCAVEIEIPLVMIYQGESAALAILTRLNDWGFTMISAQTERWNRSEMMAADFDALFVRTKYLTLSIDQGM